MNIIENVLSNLCVFFSGCASEDVEIDVKPIINFLVNCMIVITDFPRGLSLLCCSSFGSGSILISSTNINDVVANLSEITCRHVS
jgi:hypothetical protein